MDPAVHEMRIKGSSMTMSPQDVLFHDGFGDRLQVRDQAGQPLESLLLRSELSAVPSFEFALNERFKALEQFDHPSFLRVKGVIRVPGRLPRVSIVSDYLPGVRLTEVLTAMENQGAPRSAGGPLFLIQEILAAVAALHREGGDVSHGALAPDRIVIADGKVRVTDYVLGSAIEQLRLPSERYWKELRVAVPASAGAVRFDKRLDVAQVGTIALALFAGRPLGDDEDMGSLGPMLMDLALAQPLQTWLLRTLHMDPRRAYVSAAEAGTELEAAMAEAGVRPSPLELRALGVRRATAAITARSAVKASAPNVAANEPGVRHAKRSHDAAAQTQTMYVPGTTVPAFVVPTGFSKTMRSVVTLGVVGAAIAVAFTGAQYVPVPASMFSRTGTLIIESKPQGVPLTVDGQPQGVTPVTLQLESGRHEVELRGTGKPRIFNVFVSRGAHISQYIEMPSRGRSAQPPTPARVLAEPAPAELIAVEPAPAPVEPAPVALTP
jgi:PEGA domain-containing protein